MPRSNDDKPFLTFPAAAALAGVDRVTIWKMARETGAVYGVPIVHQRGNRYVVPRAALERVLAGETDAPEAKPLPWDRT